MAFKMINMLPVGIAVDEDSNIVLLYVSQDELQPSTTFYYIENSETLGLIDISMGAGENPAPIDIRYYTNTENKKKIFCGYSAEYVKMVKMLATNHYSWVFNTTGGMYGLRKIDCDVADKFEAVDDDDSERVDLIWSDYIIDDECRDESSDEIVESLNYHNTLYGE